MQYNKKEFTTFSNRLAVGSRDSWRAWQQLSKFLSWKTHEWVDLHFVLWKLKMLLLWRTFLLTFTVSLFKLHDPLILMNKEDSAILNTFLLKHLCSFKWPLYWRGLLSHLFYENFIPSFSYLSLTWHITVFYVKVEMLWVPFKIV